MALTTAEIWRIRAELGYNVLTVGAEPFISTTALFETIIKTYISTGAATTSATAVVAAVPPVPVTIVLASAIGFATGDRIWVDVEDRMESSVIQSLSGANATVELRNAHSGTYPVAQDGGEAMVREILAKIKGVKEELVATYGSGSLKRVDEVEFYGTNNKTQFGIVGEKLMFWRDELASILGAINAWRLKRSAGGTVAMY